jgi:hypothetical protein
MIICKCCGEQLVCPCGIVQTGKIAQSVGFQIQMPWQGCPTCGMSLEGVRFHTPKLEARMEPPKGGIKL